MSSYIETEQSDPRSVFYKRVLVRPQVNPGPLFIVPTAFVAVFLLDGWMYGSPLGALFHTALVALALMLCFARHVVSYLIKCYQAYAPEAVRNRCRYEPSCSQYMLLALEKYGFWKGLSKGLRRWSGCKPPAGGYDMP